MQVGSTWVVQDLSGTLWRIGSDFSSGPPTPEKLATGHSGAINGLAVSPKHHFAVTAGEDGSVRCWDYVDKKELYHTAYGFAATSVTFAPESVDSETHTIAVGFEDGVVRILLRTADSFKRLHVLKPHNDRITNLAYSSDGRYLVTGSDDNKVFILCVNTDESSADGKSYT